MKPLEAAQLVAACYQPAFMAGGGGGGGGGGMPDLSAAPGWAFQAALFADDEKVGPVCYGLLAAGPTGEQCIAIRGTQTTIEWIEDAEIALVPNPWGPGKVHAGFARLTASLGLGPSLPISNLLGPLNALSVAGHSLGAAMARLLTARLGGVGACYTWGEPKGAESTAAAYIASAATIQHRGVNEKDLVPMVPEYVPLLFPFVHSVPEITLGKVGNTLEEAHNLQGTYIPLEILAATPPCPSTPNPTMR